MDAYLEPDPETPQGWDFNLFDQGCLQMFGLSDDLNPWEHSQIVFNDSLGIPDISYALDCSFPGIDISSGFNSTTLYGVEVQHPAEFDWTSLGGSQLPLRPGSPASKIQNVGTLAPKESRTGNLDEFLVEFEISRPPTLGRNHRRPYRPEKRKKVERVRKAGACLRCRLLKRPCKIDLPCDGCLKHCGSRPLGRALCVRQKLLDVRNTTDLWERQRDLSWIKDEVPLVLTNPKRIVQLSFWDNWDTNIFLEHSDDVWNGGHDGPYILPALFEIEVQDFVPLPGTQDRHNVHVLDDNGFTLPAETFYYAIPEESLPTLESLETWALELTRFKRRAIFGDTLQGSFMSLARRYYECEEALPLSDLMQKAVRLSCLHGLWCSALQEPRMSHQQRPIYASKAVNMQIGVILSQGIEVLELDVLGQLQSLIFHSKGPGKDNRLPIWACLWLLMCTYRRTILHSVREEKGELDLLQHMYEILISIYSGLFRPSSPLWLNFLEDEVFQQFGRDFKIVERLGTVKTEVGYILNSVNEDDDFRSSRDALLRTLVLDHERRLGRKAYAKALSRPGDVWTPVI